MQYQSTRFGRLDIADEAVITFPNGIIGLPGERYALLAQSESSAFYWLHSLEDPAVALPVTNPGLFFNDYVVELSDETAERLGLDDASAADVFCVVRAAERLEDFTANLRGPIVVNAERRVGYQVINDAATYDVREPLFAGGAPTDLARAQTSAPVAAIGG